MGILRLLLALSVLLAHSSPLFGISSVGGALAVQAFYIISGFYMSLILNEKYVGNNSSYRLFLSNRLLRLYPIYWLVLIAQLAYYLLGYFQGFSPAFIAQYKQHLMAGQMSIATFLLLIIVNIFLFFQDVIMFLGLDTHTGTLFFTPNFKNTSPQLYTFLLVPQAWTVGIELLFYVIAPFLVRKRIRWVVLMVLASICLRIFIIKFFSYREDPWSYRFFPTELVFFLFGNLAYRLYKRVENIALPVLACRIIYWVMSALIIGYQFIGLPSPLLKLVYFSLVVLLIPILFISTKRNRFDLFIGELSYPVYISHMFVIGIMTVTVMRWGLQPRYMSAVLIPLTIIFSLGLNEWVAKPIERIRQGRLKQQPVALTVAENTHPL